MSMAGGASPAMGRVAARRAAHAHYVWLVPAGIFQVLAILARAQRWVVLLEQGARLGASFWAQGVGYLFTNVLPLRMGEPARVLIMAERCRLPVMQVATTAVVERLLDTATIVLARCLRCCRGCRCRLWCRRVGFSMWGGAFAHSCARALRAALPSRQRASRAPDEQASTQPPCGGN